MSSRHVDLIFLEVDMAGSGKGSCQACDVAKQQLGKALSAVEPMLREVDVELRVNEMLVSTEDQAKRLRFRGSPTLRIGHVEVAPAHVPDREDRIWKWRDRAYATPPVGLLVEAILRGSAGPDTDVPPATEPYEVPAYLASYLQKEPAQADSCTSCG
jgi:Domain of unknown function (DUF2703)